MGQIEIGLGHGRYNWAKIFYIKRRAKNFMKFNLVFFQNSIM